MVDTDGEENLNQILSDVFRCLTHRVDVGVVLQSVLPDEVCVRHELADGDVSVLVDVGQQCGKVHGLLDHHEIVWDLKESEERRRGIPACFSSLQNEHAFLLRY